MKPKKLISAILLMFVAGLFSDSAIAAERPTTLTINNVAPSFTSGPSDGPSSGTLPTNAGNLVTITAMAHDNNADQYYLAVCKSDAITPHNNSAPTCATDQTWAISTSAVNTDTPTSVTYTTSSGNIESNDWFAFVCDKNASGLCSSSSQGTGDDGSPFKVNHAPSFSNVKIGPTCGSTDPVPPGNYSSGGGGPLWSLDSNFNSGGIVTTTVSVIKDDSAQSVAVQSDGKIVAAGYSINNNSGTHIFALARYNTDGSLDTDFGTGGKVTTTMGNGTFDEARAVAIQDDGKIVAAGVSFNGSTYDFALVRYTTTGALDPTFGTGGIVSTNVGGDYYGIQSIAIQSDGKIVASGGGNGNFIIARYNTNGSLDTDFDTDGIVTTTVSVSGSAAYAVAIQDDEKIVAAGWAYIGGYRFALVRNNSNGSLDTDFDTDGIVTTAVGAGDSSGSSVAIQSDGKIVAGGGAYDESWNRLFAVVRYDADGSLDTDFDTDGIATTVMGNDAQPNSVAIQDDEKIVAAGISNNEFAVVRYNSNGSLDTDFDTDGIVTTAYGVGYSATIQSNGKIVVVGYSYNGSNNDFALVRYNTDGSLDTSFDTDGIVNTDFGSSVFNASIRSTAIQSDGKIVVAGTGDNGTENDFVLARYNTDGTLDGNFGGGIVITPVDSWAQAYAVAIQDDGKIVAAGKSNNGGDYDIAVVRYNSDGTLDTTFGGDGIVTTQIGGGGDQEQANVIAIDSNGKILVAGKHNNGSKDNFVLVRYNDDGTLDSSFDEDGIVTTSIWSGNDQAFAVAIDSDGNIVAAGSSHNGTNDDFALVRYTADGTPDSGFGIGGKVTTAVGSYEDVANSVAIDSDGNIVAAGYSHNGNNYDFAVVRYNDDGTLDTSFSGDGIVTTAIGSDQEQANAVAILGDGKIVAAGYSDNGINLDFAVVSYNIDGSPDTDFGTNGIMTEAVGSSDDEAFAVTIQDDGAMVVAGKSYNGTNDDFALVRYVRSSTSGFLDDTFGTSGAVTTPIAFNSTDEARSTAIQSDGKIVAVGNSDEGTHSAFSLVRYNTNGSLDSAFGSGGKVTTAVGSYNSSATSVAIQSDGKIVVAGDAYDQGSSQVFAVVRYNTNGSLDTAFGTDGIVLTDVWGGHSYAKSVAIQSDGKIVVGGIATNTNNTTYYIALVRYTSDGELDTSFSGDGMVTTSLGGNYSLANDIAIDGDGKIVAVGYSYNGSNDDFAVVRYNSNGTLDTGFSGDGMVTTSLGSGYDIASSVAIQSSGEIVVAGSSDVGGGNYDFALVRYNSDGTLDTDFSGDGKLTTAIGSGEDVANSVAIDSVGNIVATGYSHNGSNNDFAVVRYTSVGSLDTTFSGDGKLTTAIGSSDDQALSVAIQTDGGIVAAGSSYIGNNNDYALVRYTSDGTLDTDFDTDGIVTTAVGSRLVDATVNSVAIQDDGKIVTAGGTSANGKNYFLLTRYTSNGLLDTTFGTGGILTTEIGLAQSDSEGAKSVAIQSDGKIVAAGSSHNGSNYDFALARYTANGTLDTSFSEDGIVTTAVGDNSSAYSVAVQNNGAIVAAGKSNNGSNDAIALVRYTSNGSLDSTFSGDGIVTTAVGSNDAEAYSVAIQSNGMIVAAGTSNAGSGNFDFALARYDSNGSLDTDFDTDGIVTTAVGTGGDGGGRSVAIQSDGKIVAAGNSYNNNRFALVRYKADGSLDSSFGRHGKVTTPLGAGEEGSDARSVAIQSDGKIVVAGRYYYGDGGVGFKLIRYYANGRRDPSFGSGGIITDGAIGGSQSVAIQSDGGIVAAAGTHGIVQDFTVVRYTGIESGGGGGGTPLTDFICIQAEVTDTDIDTVADTVDMHVCSSNSFVDGQCADTTLCTDTGVASGAHAQCSIENIVPVPTPHGTYDVYVFVKDNHGFQGTGTSTQGYDVEDVPPVVISYTVTDAPAPSAGGSDTMDFSVAIHDDNGDNDVTGVNGVFYDDDAIDLSSGSCTPSDNNCYLDSTCTLSDVNGGADTELTASCSVTVWFNADYSTEWKAHANPSDQTTTVTDSSDSSHITNPSLQGIDVAETSIAYGTVVIGGTSAGKETSMGNVGNQILDVYVSGTSMTSGSYSIPVGQQKWFHTSDPFDWDATATSAGPYTLVDTPTGTRDAGGCMNRDIAVRTVHGTADTNESIFWKLRIPAGQQAGSYTGQNTFSTTSGATCSTGASY